MPCSRNSVCFMCIVLKLYFSLITTLVECLACGRHLIDICEIDKLIIITLYKEPFRMYSVGDSVPSRKLLAPLNVAAIDVIAGGEWGSGVGECPIASRSPATRRKKPAGPNPRQLSRDPHEVCSPPPAQLEPTVLLRSHSCMVAVHSVEACATLVFTSKGLKGRSRHGTPTANATTSYLLLPPKSLEQWFSACGSWPHGIE